MKTAPSNTKKRYMYNEETEKITFYVPELFLDKFKELMKPLLDSIKEDDYKKQKL